MSIIMHSSYTIAGPDGLESHCLPLVPLGVRKLNGLILYS